MATQAFIDLLTAYEARESVLDDLARQRDALIQEVLALKRELKKRDELLDELCNSFNELKGGIEK